MDYISHNNSKPSQPVQVRLHGGLLSTVDGWRRRQWDLPTRPEAIRRLLRQALLARSVTADQETNIT